MSQAEKSRYSSEEAHSEAMAKQLVSIPTLLRTQAFQKLFANGGEMPTAAYELADQHIDAIHEQYPKMYDALLKWAQAYAVYQHTLFPNYVSDAYAYADRKREMEKADLPVEKRDALRARSEQLLEDITSEVLQKLSIDFGLENVTAKAVARKFVQEYPSSAQQVTRITQVLGEVSQELHSHLPGFEEGSDMQAFLDGVNFVISMLQMHLHWEGGVNLQIDVIKALKKQGAYQASVEQSSGSDS